MIKQVDNIKLLKQFIEFPKTLYKDEPHYVHPLYAILTKELKKLILRDKTYKAFIYIEDKKIVGRILITYDKSNHRHEEVCYFSMLDMIDDIDITKALFDEVYQDMKDHQINYLEGTFTPYDPDTRRGILIQGFDSDPSLFTSYNYAYYQNHLDSLGFTKAFDTFLLDGGEISQKSGRLLKRVHDYAVKHDNIRIDFLNINDIDSEVEDIYHVLDDAHNDIIYQETPTKEMLHDGFRQLKAFINPEFVTIARRNEDNKPIGFAMVLPDFNQVIKKAKGQVWKFPFINRKKTINQAIGKLQYVIPMYQNKGTMAAMYYHIYESLKKHGITSIDMGTMMEENYKAFNHFSKFGGSLKKVFRIYGKEI